MGVFKDMFEQAKENGVSKAAIVLGNNDVVVLAKSKSGGYILVRLMAEEDGVSIMSASVNILPIVLMQAEGTASDIGIVQEGIGIIKESINVVDAENQLESEENTEAIFRKFDDFDEQSE